MSGLAPVWVHADFPPGCGTLAGHIMKKMNPHFIACVFLCVGCSRNEAAGLSASKESQRPAPEAARTSPEPGAEKASAPALEPRSAKVGDLAPPFALPDLDGSSVSLEEHRGKIVVLEWFNPECPFVRAAHTEGSLVDTAKKLQERGVSYLAINSGAPTKQGYGKEANEAGKERFGMNHPVLLDEKGTVGRAYGATNTPHIFVIGRDGKLAYSGAVDNSPDGEGKSPVGGKLVNYLTQAVSELEAGDPVSVKQTKAYGCSVKYAD